MNEEKGAHACADVSAPTGETVVPFLLSADQAPEKPKTKAPKQTDDEWLISLKSNPAYAGIDVDRERAKCQAWCDLHRKVMSRARLLNWLNRCERPLKATGTGGLEHRFNKF